MTRPTRILPLATAAAVLALAGHVGASTAATNTETQPATRSALRLPTPTGERPIGTATLHLADRSRRDLLAPTRMQRRLVVQLWYPAATPSRPNAGYATPAIASLLEQVFGLPTGTFTTLRTHARIDAPIARGRHPLLLLSHGLGTLREFHTALAADLASRGYIVAAIAHTYDAAAVELADGRVIRGTAPAEPTESQRTLLLRTRVGDVRFVIDELLERSRARTGPLADRIAVDKIGALGHSLGGATTAAAMLADPRIRAGVDLDGTIFGPVVTEGLGRPFMLVVGDHELAPDQSELLRHLRSARYALSLRGAGHFSFTDLPLFATAVPGLDQAFDIGTIDPLRAHRAVCAYLAAFFDHTLRNRQAALLERPSAAYPEVGLLTTEPRSPSLRARHDAAVRTEVAPVGR